MRVIAHRERPHPGAKLCLIHADGWRVTTSTTNSAGGQLADLEVRHWSHARPEDPMRPRQRPAQPPTPRLQPGPDWLDTVLLAGDLIAWTATLGLTAHWAAEPKRIGYGWLHVAARIIRTGRRTILKLPARWPWAPEITAAHSRLRTHSPPG